MPSCLLQRRENLQITPLGNHNAVIISCNDKFVYIAVAMEGLHVFVHCQSRTVKNGGPNWIEWSWLGFRFGYILPTRPL